MRSVQVASNTIDGVFEQAFLRDSSVAFSASWIVGLGLHRSREVVMFAAQVGISDAQLVAMFAKALEDWREQGLIEATDESADALDTLREGPV